MEISVFFAKFDSALCVSMFEFIVRFLSGSSYSLNEFKFSVGLSVFVTIVSTRAPLLIPVVNF